MNKVIAAKANDDFSLDLQFNDGSVKRDSTLNLIWIMRSFANSRILGTSSK